MRMATWGQLLDIPIIPTLIMGGFLWQLGCNCADWLFGYRPYYGDDND